MNSKELAKLLGVSTATMSLIINGKPGISDKTRADVIQRMTELGYADMIKPKNEEKSPAATSTKSIGFVLYQNAGKMLGDNAFYPVILNSAENTARVYQYNLVIINIDKNHVEEQAHYVLEAGCIGYVLFAVEMNEHDLTFFQSLGLPFVILDNYFMNLNVNTVKVNNEQGCTLAIRYLIEMGHSKIGYLSGGLMTNSFIERRNYSKAILRRHGISLNDSNTYTIGYPIDEAREGMSQVFQKYSKDELPTAFFADNDLVAIGAMQAAKDFGYRIPDDFSFVGNADREISSIIEPKLTTLYIPHERFGSEAVYQLIQQFERKMDSFVKIEVNCKLVVRDSVKDLRP